MLLPFLRVLLFGEKCNSEFLLSFLFFVCITSLFHMVPRSPRCQGTLRSFGLDISCELAGAYIADMVVDGRIILELKSVQVLSSVMDAQILNYLRLSGVQVGYLVNFRNQKVAWKRFVLGRE
jgi:hypothetical protein